MTREEENRVREILFRESRGLKTDFKALSEDTGIPERTLRRWKNCPDSMPLSKAMVIAKAMGLSNREAGFILTGVGIVTADIRKKRTKRTA